MQIFKVLIGLAAMVYEPLYHAREVATINFLVALEKEISKAYQYYLIVFNKTIIPLALVGYEMIIANSALSYVGYLSSHIQCVHVE